jgi:hypothetical protein
VLIRSSRFAKEDFEQGFYILIRSERRLKVIIIVVLVGKTWLPKTLLAECLARAAHGGAKSCGWRFHGFTRVTHNDVIQNRFGSFPPALRNFLLRNVRAPLARQRPIPNFPTSRASKGKEDPLFVAMKSIAVSLFLILSAATAVAAASERILKQVHVVTRHGSRLVLRKGDNLREFTEGPLTFLGQKQTYDLGLWIKSTYNNKNTSFFFDSFQQDKVTLESSSFERTVTSANSIALGLFNATARDPLHQSLLPKTLESANVPVYSRDVANDYIIRAYDKCPDGLQLDALYSSIQFQSLAQKYSSLLQFLGSMPRFSPFTDASGGSIAVDLVWNVYDSFEVAKTECG